MLTRWNDWGFGDFDRTLAEFDALRREMNRLFETEPSRWMRGATATAAPRVALYDRGSELLLRAELPGVAEKDLDITVDQGVLTIKGERKVDAPEGYAAFRQERPAFTFARSFNLPARVDPEKAQATLKDGMLTMVLPKAPEDQPRQIKVSASQ
jgi:HSP20 family protein